MALPQESPSLVEGGPSSGSDMTVTQNHITDGFVKSSPTQLHKPTNLHQSSNRPAESSPAHAHTSSTLHQTTDGFAESSPAQAHITSHLHQITEPSPAPPQPAIFNPHQSENSVIDQAVSIIEKLAKNHKSRKGSEDMLGNIVLGGTHNYAAESFQGGVVLGVAIGATGLYMSRFLPRSALWARMLKGNKFGKHSWSADRHRFHSPPKKQD